MPGSQVAELKRDRATAGPWPFQSQSLGELNPEPVPWLLEVGEGGGGGPPGAGCAAAAAAAGRGEATHTKEAND